MAVEIVQAGASLERALLEAARKIFSTLAAQPKDAPLTIGLCGGRSVVGLLTALERESHQQPGDLLGRVQFFMVDERLVPLTDEQSNFGGLKKLLFEASQLHPFVTDDIQPDFGCASYAEELYRFGGRFTVVVLGVGEDGHVAGLFPQHLVLRNEERAFFSFKDSPKPPLARMTAGKALITAASLSILLFLGEGKRAAWSAFNAAGTSTAECPALLATAAESCVIVTDLAG
jgi:6-phosphogluconolactonase